MADETSPATPLEPPIGRDVLDAWAPHEPTVDFADRVLEASVEPRRPRLATVRSVAAAAAILLGIGLGLRLGPTSSPPAQPDELTPTLLGGAMMSAGEHEAVGPDEVQLGEHARARLKDGAALRWRLDDAEGLRVEQYNGMVSYDVEPGEQLNLRTPQGDRVLLEGLLDVNADEVPATESDASLEVSY